MTEITGPQVALLGFENPSEPELPIPYLGDWYQKVKRIRRDPTIALVRQLAVAPVLIAPWSYEEEEDKAPEGARDFIEEVFKPLRSRFLRQAFHGMIDYGWAPFEMIFELIGGQVRLTKLKNLLTEFTEILIVEENGEFAGFKQGDDLYLDLNKSLLISQDVEGTQWYGSSTMLNVERAYDDAQEVNKAAARYDRKVAGTHWVVYYPLGKSDFNGEESVDNFEIAKSILNGLEASGQVAVPRTVQTTLTDLNMTETNTGVLSWEIVLLTDTGSSRASFLDRLDYLDKLKVRGFGFPERSILEGNFGTKAEASEHGSFALTNTEVRHSEAVDELNSKAVNMVLEQNWGLDARDTVKIVPGSVSTTQRAWLRELYGKILSNSQGFLSEIDNLDLEGLRDRLDIPSDKQAESEEEEEKENDPGTPKLSGIPAR